MAFLKQMSYVNSWVIFSLFTLKMKKIEICALYSRHY